MVVKLCDVVVDMLRGGSLAVLTSDAASSSVIIYDDRVTQITTCYS